MSAAEATTRPASVDVEDLRIALTGTDIDVVDEIALEIYPGEVLGLVGESGSGKTTVGMALLGHVRRGGEVGGGEILIDGRDLSSLSTGELRRLRGGTVSYIPQDPGTSLNPALRIGTQLEEILEAHQPSMNREQRMARLREALDEVALPSDDTFLKRYPHQLSGGQQQRVAIAMAFANRPRVIVCDEPTTGLDVTTQAVVMDIVAELAAETGMATILITHDLALAAERSGRIAVMHAGHIVEDAPTAALLAAPRHPYTRRLLAATPTAAGDLADLRSIPGSLPDLRRDDLPPCRFAARCTQRLPACEAPLAWRDLAPAHRVACWNPA